jgi:hypothetical protein
VWIIRHKVQSADVQAYRQHRHKVQSADVQVYRQYRQGNSKQANVRVVALGVTVCRLCGGVVVWIAVCAVSVGVAVDVSVW